jgi:hypothetical protein
VEYERTLLCSPLAELGRPLDQTRLCCTQCGPRRAMHMATPPSPVGRAGSTQCVWRRRASAQKRHGRSTRAMVTESRAHHKFGSANQGMLQKR